MTQHAESATSERPGGFRVTGRMVLLTFIGFFVVVASVNAVMVTSAVRTFSGVETENAYKAGLAFNESIAAAGAQDALGWRVEIAPHGRQHRLYRHRARQIRTPGNRRLARRPPSSIRMTVAVTGR